jgi:hypothetical protein
MNRVKYTLVAVGLSFAMAFIFGCGGTKTAESVSGAVKIKDIADEMTLLCEKEYAATNFCGIGEGKSGDKEMARTIANQVARRNLGMSVQTHVDGRVKEFGANDPSMEALKGAVTSSVSKVNQDLTDIHTRDSQTTMDSEKKYTVYVLLTTSRAAAAELAKQKLLADQEVMQLARTLNLSNVVEKMFEETK